MPNKRGSMSNMLCSENDTHISLSPSLENLAGKVNSPVRSFRQVNKDPMIASAAHGAFIQDHKGNQYLDFCMSWGASILGHAHKQVNNNVFAQCSKGSTYGVTTQIEALLAQKIVSHISFIDQLRFVSSGTEATMSAARLARGHTGKNKIIKFTGCYHGHSDQFLIKAGSSVAELSESSSLGVPPSMVHETIILPYNNVDSLQAWLKNISNEDKNDIAAIILEPIAGNMGCIPATPAFIHALNDLKDNLNCLIIADEVITGYRFKLGDISTSIGLKADIICLGKIIGGGYPAAAFGARKEIMDMLAPTGSVYQAGTLSGNPVAMTAGHTVISLLESEPIYNQLSLNAHALIDPVQAYIEGHGLPVLITSYHSLFSIFFNCHNAQGFEDLKEIDTQAFSQLFDFLYQNGVFIPPSAYEAWFISSQHTRSDLAHTAELIIKFLKKWYRDE